MVPIHVCTCTIGMDGPNVYNRDQWMVHMCTIGMDGPHVDT